ncbi:MAG: hypothetical protein KGJ13_09800 [Patescibacteria group bacterium]|nr:hypothetical protein [Patescibacteria group bacterium]
MHNFLASLSGYKTYIVAIATVFYAAVEYWDGTLNQAAAVGMVLGALGLGALRNGINKQ